MKGSRFQLGAFEDDVDVLKNDELLRFSIILRVPLASIVPFLEEE